MNIAKIAAVLKKQPEIIVWQTSEPRQYIGNPFVVYDISEMPMLRTEEQVFAVLGISSEKQNRFALRFGKELPKIIGERKDEEGIDPINTKIYTPEGKQCCIFKNDTAAIFIQEIYLKPLEDVVMYQYFVREGEDGTRLLIVDDGMLGPTMYVMECKKGLEQAFMDFRNILRLAKRN